MTYNRHLEYFKVKNFKRFDELELDGLGQFNLVTGDNNVGKTSLLEALLVGGMHVEDQAYAGIFWALHRTLNIRGLELNLKFEYNEVGEVSRIEFPESNYLSFLQGDISKRTDFILRYWKEALPNKYWFQSFRREELAEKIANDNNRENLLRTAPPTARYFTQVGGPFSNQIYWNWLHYEELKHGPTNKAEVADIAFIPVSQSNAEFLANNLTRLYSLVNPNLSKPIDLTLVEYLRTLIPDLEDLKVGGSPSTLYVRLNRKDEGTPINLYGDGVVRLTRLLFHLFVTQSPRLMIDEIDTGIHYSRLKDFLKCLVNLADKKNVQLFMTTHSLECQQAFAEVFEDPEMVHLKNEFRNITLVEAQDHSVKPFIYNHEQLTQNLELGIETRGRKLA